ncbi:MAG: penicillin-binding protein 2 [Rickettsiales bacterium]|jgi:cell division protein FtsI (penicillin-binding protein 3)|nr:penicillin-binding protein 2 [Rickettsiales bacterium]
MANAKKYKLNYLSMKLDRTKSILIFSAVILVFFLVTTRMFILSVLQYSSIDARNTFISDTIKKRVSIVDRNGKLIAGDLNTKTLYINSHLLENEDFVARKLSETLNMDYSHLYRKLMARNRRTRYILIKKHVLPSEELIIRELPIASIVFEDSFLRYYPYDNLFSHIVGYVDLDGRGMLGLEEYYDKYLGDTENQPLRSTLDIRIQSVLREELRKASELYSPNFIVGIVEEIKTGNIMAMVSLPDFNPNRLSDIVNTFNHATYGGYELGSLLKVFTVANGLELNVISANSEFDVTRDINYGKFVIKDIDSIKYRKRLNTGEVLALSSNIGTVAIARKIGADRQLGFFEKIGILEKLEIDINQVSLPMQPRKWKDINLITIAYGYGIAASPLHILNAMSGIINDGNMITPRFTYNFKSQKKLKIVSNETSMMIRDFMRLAVTMGTGRLANIAGYDIGGKTGTARKITSDGYQKGAHVASFFGAFPMDNPQYSIIVVMDRPKGTAEKNMDATGGSAATIITKNIILKIIPLLNWQR